MENVLHAALVTGGGGFLGGALVDALLARGARVGSISRGAYPALEARGVETFRADLGDPTVGPRALRDALETLGADTVFHCAALPGVWGPAARYERANVAATHHVVEACLAAGVPRLVFTSSPSVVFDGEDHRMAGPDLPYPERFLTHYPRTKAEAERAALAANGDRLATIALRPHLVFGPGDPNLVPRLLERADAGRLRIVGDGTSEVSLTYVDNAAAAHLTAAEALADPALVPGCAGRPFFVNNREPVPLWDWIGRILEGTGRRPVTRRIPAGVAYAAGATLETLWRALRRRNSEPPMTRFVAKQLATHHTYDMAPFERAMGGMYREPVDMDEATARTIAAFSPA